MDENTPVGHSEALCSQCGAQLSVKHDGIELKGDDRCICPIHGDVGSLQDIRRSLYEQQRDEVIKHAQGLARKTLKRS